mmetsp:Transcript_23997/g.47670  ORF Transcript_23997/g.47670 Transcript_23997/m.47670 type:complete len:96 (-) Transcript_23997:1798-2085(-)
MDALIRIEVGESSDQLETSIYRSIEAVYKTMQLRKYHYIMKSTHLLNPIASSILIIVDLFSKLPFSSAGSSISEASPTCTTRIPSSVNASYNEVT